MGYGSFRLPVSVVDWFIIPAATGCQFATDDKV